MPWIIEPADVGLDPDDYLPGQVPIMQSTGLFAPGWADDIPVGRVAYVNVAAGMPLPTVAAEVSGPVPVLVTIAAGMPLPTVAAEVTDAAAGDFASVMASLTPLSWWRVNEASGSFLDQQNLNALGNASGSVTYQRPGWTADGDYSYGNNSTSLVQTVGTNDYQLNELTLHAAIKTTKSGTGMVFTRDNQTNARHFQFRHTGGNLELILFYANGGIVSYVTSGQALNNGDWHQVVASYDGTSGSAGVTLYIDGQSVAHTATTLAGTPGTTLQTATNGRLYCGAIGGTASGLRLEGDIDEPAIFNRELTGQEVADLWSAHSVP
jgi:hypothetical protein